MKYLLDTNVLSDARRRRSEQLERWLSEQEVGDLAISIITLLEIERGIRRKQRADPAGAAPLWLWLNEDVRPLFAGRVLAVDESVASVASGLHVPDPMPEMDALIAATARVHGLVLVTRNTKGFMRAAVPLIDPSAMR